MLESHTKLRLHLRKLISPPSFVIYHIGRSGSSVLTDMLAQNPELQCAGEIFHGYYGEAGKREAVARGKNSHSPWLKSDYFVEKPKEYIEAYLSGCSLRAQFGFEIKFAHLRLNSISQLSFLMMLNQLNFDKIIILKRKNYLRKIVSSLVGKARKKMHADVGEELSLTKLNIDFDSIEIDSESKPLITFLDDYDEEFRVLEKLIVNRANVLELTYEDDVQDSPLIAYRKICAFLRVPPLSDVRIPLQRTTPQPLNDIVLNFRELDKYLRGTQYSWMVND